MNPRPIRFLDLDVVLKLHRIAIEDQGGNAGIRDLGLLEAALGMPRQQFGGEYLHAGIPAMAAAYAFHLCRNHPFVDGNKRTSLACLLAFLTDNGWAFEAPDDEVEGTIMRVADGTLPKEQLTEWVRGHSREKPTLELRDLFRAVTPEAVQQLQGALDRSTGPEMSATVEEAAAAIPLVAERMEAAQQAAGRGDHRVEAASLGQALLLVVIYRIAEDMGYEW